jgi:hypothetical protein
MWYPLGRAPGGADRAPPRFKTFVIRLTAIHLGWTGEGVWYRVHPIAHFVIGVTVIERPFAYSCHHGLREWSLPEIQQETVMNTEMRQLTTEELEVVSGGSTFSFNFLGLAQVDMVWGNSCKAVSVTGNDGQSSSKDTCGK